MASKDLWLSEQDLNQLDNAELERCIGAELGRDLAHRTVEVRKAATDALATPRGGGDNAVKVMIPLPPAKGAVMAVRGSKADV